MDAAIVDTARVLNQAIAEGRRVLFEGAQGTLLDLDHGTYPYVTSSSPLAGGVGTGCGVGPTRIGAVVGVAKAYATRVGNGPFPTELPADEAKRMRDLGEEFGATTGRPRRCGWFDAVALRQAVMLNGATSLAVTKLDVLDGFPEIGLCTAYRVEGRTVDFPPPEPWLFERAEPVYEMHAGWRTSTREARRWEDLPAAARSYLERIEALSGVPVGIVSVGSGRDQVLVR
jgi:adenylosuccinate synthase